MQYKSTGQEPVLYRRTTSPRKAADIYPLQRHRRGPRSWPVTPRPIPSPGYQGGRRLGSHPRTDRTRLAHARNLKTLSIGTFYVASPVAATGRPENAPLHMDTALLWRVIHLAD